MAVSWLTTGAEVAQVSEAVGKIGRMLPFTGDEVRNASTAACNLVCSNALGLLVVQTVLMLWLIKEVCGWKKTRHPDANEGEAPVEQQAPPRDVGDWIFVTRHDQIYVSDTKGVVHQTQKCQGLLASSTPLTCCVHCLRAIRKRGGKVKAD